MIPILEKRQRIWVDNFNMLPGWQEKYAYLIDLGEIEYILDDGQLLYYTKNK